MISPQEQAEASLARIREYLATSILLVGQDLQLMRVAGGGSPELSAIVGKFEEVLERVRLAAEKVMDDAHALTLTASALESVNLATQLVGTVARMHRGAIAQAPSIRIGD